MNISQAKKISLYDLLSEMGFLPVEAKKSGTEVWYLSPFRSEKTPSFKIHVDRNIWYDFGEGKGGNILDFVMQYNKCNLQDALAFLDNRNFRNSAIIPKPFSNDSVPELFDKPNPKILEIKPVYSYSLKEYLKERGIELSIAYKYLREIRYQIEGKEFFALGFSNRAGGYELRNAAFKGCIGKKDISIFEIGSEKVSIFEGFMDFLSYLTIYRIEKPETDIIILNSVALKRLAFPFIRSKQYSGVCTYLDNDKAGEGALKSFGEELTGTSLIPCNSHYQGFNDLNDYLKSIKVKNTGNL